MLPAECEDIQRNELQALQSIYPEEFELDKLEAKLVWNKTPVPSFQILVQVSHDDMSGSGNPFNLPSVKLHVSYPIFYPQVLPKMELRSPNRLARTELQELQKFIEDAAKSLVGTEMVYDLVDILRTRLKNFVRPVQVSSLIDERAARIDEIEALRKAEAHDHATKEADLKAEQDAEMRSRIDDELQSKKSAFNAVPTVKTEALADIRTISAGVIHLSRALNLEHVTLDMLSIGVPLVPNDQTITKPHLTYVQGFGQLVVKEFQIAVTAIDGLKSIEAAVKHSFLNDGTHDVKFGVQNYGSSLKRNEDSHWTLYIVQQHTPKGSLQNLLDIVGTISLHQAKTWLTDLAQEISFAHRYGYIHQNITPSKILLFEGHSRTIPRLADWGYSYLIHKQDVYFEASKVALTNKGGPRPSGRRADDVADLGVTFLEMIFGQSLRSAKSVEQFLVDSRELQLVEPALAKFIHDLFAVESRLTASDLLASDFLRSVEASATSLPPASIVSPAVSRYSTDFQELERIGSGGYGTVFKAKNRLDNRVYAVKKQDLRNSTISEARVLREVAGLARLNHVGIVRYFSSWVEDTGHVQQKSVSTSSSFSSEFDSEIVLDELMSTSGVIFANSENLDKRDREKQQSILHDTDAVGATDFEVSLPRTLFIQMEFCSGKSLRDIIDSGNVGQLYWTYFSQIVDGVQYIHEQGLIHRDLKPANIFVSKEAQLKLGDFGLAAEIAVDTLPNFTATHGVSVNDENTGDLGTFLYQAPELGLGKPLASYDAKIDLYALGIIFAELCSRWNTGMERINAIRALRAPEIICTLDSTRQQRETTIVRTLLSHGPADRPSAQELSSMLPPMMPKNHIKDTLKLLDSDSAFRRDVVDNLFCRVSGLTEYVYSTKGYTSDAGSSLVTSRVVQSIANVFRIHGAIDRSGSTAGILPLNELYSKKVNVVKLLDPASNVLQLPYDFKLPFARHIARETMREPFGKSFIIAPVYRSVSGGGQQITSMLEADFDIVTPRSSAPPDFGIETLRVAYEVLEELGRLGPERRLYLGHGAILNAVLMQADVPEEERFRVASTLSHLSRKGASITAWRRSLGAILGETSIEELLRFVPDNSLDFDAALRSIQTLVTTSSDPEISSAISSLRAFSRSVKAYRVHLPIQFQAFAHSNQTYDLTYSLEAHKSELVCVGGVYNTLVRNLRLPGAGMSDLNAAGFSLAVDKISASILSDMPSQAQPRLTDVVVSGYAHENVALELITRLWDGKIAAELCNDENPLPFCQQRRAMFSVSFRDKRLGSVQQQVLRIRNFIKEETEEISADLVLSYLLGEISEMNKNQLLEAHINVSRSSGEVTVMKEPDVVIVSIDEHRKMKLPQRQLIASKAIEAVQDLFNELKNANIPILIVDFEIDMFQQLKSFDAKGQDEPTKRLLEKFPAVARAHFASLREQISKLQSDDHTRVFVYAFRCQGLHLLVI